MNTLQSTLQQERQFVAQLPADIPLPEFDMFQRVQWQGYGLNATATGHVIGLYWVDDNSALMSQIAPGWHYLVSRIFGVTDARVVLNSNYEHETMHRFQLTFIAPVPILLLCDVPDRL
ncbi:MAG: hypothetical protein AAF773_11765 [Cyanobacteria bacterium P01_D01_bin.115]